MKTHSPTFTGTLCGAKSTALDTSPTCKRCQHLISAAHARARTRREALRELTRLTEEAGGYEAEATLCSGDPSTCDHCIANGDLENS